MRQSYVYILASERNGTLYIGVTSDLLKRVAQHRSEDASGFTGRHRVKRLVYYEIHGDIREAIAAEKRYKKWNRTWKIRMIESVNPDWNDLFPLIIP